MVDIRNGEESDRFQKRDEHETRIPSILYAVRVPIEPRHQCLNKSVNASLSGALRVPASADAPVYASDPLASPKATPTSLEVAPHPAADFSDTSCTAARHAAYGTGKPEVLAPAGNLATLKTAIDFGADAVYCGGQEFGMRSAPKNFTLEDFEQAVRYAHARHARVYATCNILPSSDEVPRMNAYMGELEQIGVDALIISDIGVLMAACTVAPHTQLHVSTQAGVTNYQTARALVELGASRIVLARELDLEAIRAIRANLGQQIELEAFVHGSMCMAFSGRCLISQHLTGRDANHGDCVQACRYKYHVVEEKRPNEFIPVEVSEQGTFLFNSQDMNLLEHVDDILDAGVTSLKIEGRAKGAYYAAVTANAYKCAVNEYLAQREAGNVQSLALPQWLREEPYKVTHREYSTGFYYRQHPASESVTRGGYINEWRWLGTVLGCDEECGAGERCGEEERRGRDKERQESVGSGCDDARSGSGVECCERAECGSSEERRESERRLRIFARNKIAPGMEIEFLAPARPPIKYRVPAAGLCDGEGNPVDQINNPAHEFSLPLLGAEYIPAGAMIRARVKQA